MAIFKSSNPILTNAAYEKSMQVDGVGELRMTERGTLNKFFLLSLLVIATASLTWSAYFQSVNIMPFVLIGGFGGFIVAMVLTFKPSWGSVLAPLYALLEGAFIGGFSAIMQFRFQEKAPDIILQAVGATFGVVLIMYFLYRFKVIKVTEKFRAIVITAAMGLILFYVVAFILRLFNVDIPFLHDSSALGIGFSVLVVGLASMFLILSFDNVQQGVAMGAPKYMEWYSAFGLVLVIVWLYLEILQLLSRMNSRN